MNSSPLPTPSQIIAHLDRFVRGQARAKQDIAVAIYNHYLSQAFRDAEGQDLGRHHILMLGPTGSGKTYIVKTVAKLLGVPVSFVSANSLVEVGYRGQPVDSIVRTLLERADGNPRLAEKGIIFLDEIDKIRRQDTGGQKDVSGEGVQNALLTLLDGRIADNVDSARHQAVDTSRVLFVCTGAFVGLQTIVDDRIGSGKSQLGFHARPKEQVDEMPDQPIYKSLCQAQTANLVDFGMIPEFIGRFATITVLHELGKADMRGIVSESTESSPLTIQQQLARIHGIDLQITNDGLDAIAEEAVTLGTEARGLHRLIGRAVDAVDARWSELADEGVCRVEINRDCIMLDHNPKLINGPSIFPRRDEDLRRNSLASIPPSPAPFMQSSSPMNVPAGIKDTRGWNEEQLRNDLEQIKRDDLSWEQTSGSARKWWEEFEKENQHRLALIHRLAQELKLRKATITEFFLAYVYSNTDNIQANLHYLDYSRLKKQDEKKRKGGDETPEADA